MAIDKQTSDKQTSDQLAADKLAADKLEADQLAKQVADAIALSKKLTAAPAVRAPTYNVSENSPRAPYGKQQVTTGSSAKTGDPAYVLVNGSSQTGFPQAAVSVLIATGIIPRATIKALWLAADNA